MSRAEPSLSLHDDDPVDFGNLKGVQDWMQSAIFFPGQYDPAQTVHMIKTGAHIDAAQALGIYQRSYLQRLILCLGEQYPALRYALGNTLFDDMARDYIRHFPPESYTLYDLGRRFKTYIDEHRPDRDLPESDREVWLDFMVALVEFERSLFILYDAAGHEGQPYAGHEAQDEDLRLQPAFKLGAYQFPVAGYYHDVRAKLQPNLPEIHPQYVALVRRDFITQTISLTKGQHFCLKKMISGFSLVQAFDALAKVSGTDVKEIYRGWRMENGPRQSWIDAGMFVEVEI